MSASVSRRTRLLGVLVEIVARRGLPRAVAAWAVVAVVGGPATAQAADVWTTAGTMNAGRIMHAATILQNGKVLLVGGHLLTLSGGGADRTTDLYDPTTDTWSAGASMAADRDAHTATLLPSGKVLVTGGKSGPRGGQHATDSAELYDPTTDTWSAAGTMTVPRQSQTATLLLSGDVLVTGGSTDLIALGITVTADLYHPATNTWSATAPMTARRMYHTATRLADGNVLVTAGVGTGSQTAELYDTTSHKWSAAGTLAVDRIQLHTETLLPDGKVLISGGRTASAVTAISELYDPATNAWSATASLPLARGGHTATLLGSGMVLVVDGASGGDPADADKALLYDPTTGVWSAAPSTAYGRMYHTATMLANGKVLISAGNPSFGTTDSHGRAEMYGPRATPTISSSATASAALGGQLTDAATIQGLDAPTPGSTVTFRLYGPGDAACSGPPIHVAPNRAVTLSGATATATATPYTVNTAGTYRWRAFFNGDVNNSPVAGLCNDTDETSTVAQATPQIAATAPASITLGDTVSGSATVTARVNAQPGAALDFRLYGPGDATCAGPAIYESDVPYEVAGGAVTSASFTPTLAGIYRWRAFYSGDQNNAPASGACNDADQSTTVMPSTPQIATTASPSIALGGQISDSATVSGRVSAQSGATIDFRLYAPDDATCSGTPVFESLERPHPVADGAVVSGSFTPTLVGTYRWRAFYSGEINNNAIAGACADTSEHVVVTASPAAATPADPAQAPPNPPPAPPKPPVARPPLGNNALLACTTAKLALINVLQTATGVTLRGAARRSLAGRRVRFMFSAPAEQIAQSTVAADGSFGATLPLPPKALRSGNQAFYRAIIGNEVSSSLKLTRRVIVTSLTSAQRTVTIRGRITLPLGRPIQQVTISRRIDCRRTNVVRTFKPSRSGRFAVTIAAPTGASSAVYLLRTAVRTSPHSSKLFLTKSLPQEVVLR